MFKLNKVTKYCQGIYALLVQIQQKKDTLQIVHTIIIGMIKHKFLK